MKITLLNFFAKIFNTVCFSYLTLQIKLGYLIHLIYAYLVCRYSNFLSIYIHLIYTFPPYPALDIYLKDYYPRLISSYPFFDNHLFS